MKCAIPECPKPARLSATGRPGRFCSNACKQKSYYRRIVTKPREASITKVPDILFYCGLNAKTWAHHPVQPGKYACIAPVYGKTKATKMINQVKVPASVEGVLMDSGAFSDKIDERLSFEEARNRQIMHAYRFGYVDQVSHIASYDLLIDEKWQDGERSKIRWSKDEAEEAVKETIAAARYLASQRRYLRGAFGHRVGLALSAQGVDVEQYMRCTTGLAPALVLPSFCEVMCELIPYLGSQGVKQIQAWGVIFPEALGYLLYLCDLYTIRLSVDSSGPARCPVTGDWGYGSWRDSTYRKPPVLKSCRTLGEQGKKAPACPPGTFCLGLEQTRHVQFTIDWLTHFREREADLYRPIKRQVYKQMSLLDMMEGA
jgi:hypothetical protein